MENNNMNNNDIDNNFENQQTENNNKNTKTLKTIILCSLAIITIFCIFYGTYRFTGKVKHNVEKIFNGEGINIGDFITNWNNDSDDEDNFSRAKTIDTSIEAFSKLDINAKVMAVTIKSGDQYHLYFSYNKEKIKPTYQIENGTLTIRQPAFSNNTGNINCKLEITVPRYTKLNDVDIELNVGEINLKGFDCDTLDITNNVGEIDIKDINFEEIDAKSNVGEISIKTMLPIEEYSLDLTTNIGEISVDGNSYRHHCSTKGSTSKKITAENNVGEIDID